jgi:hypothetical protein
LMRTEHVITQLTAGKSFVECSVHKTASTYGAAGKWLAPGTWEPSHPIFESWLCDVE